MSDRLHAVSRGALLWLGNRKNAQLVISRVPLTRRVARRFVAGDRAEDATEAIRRLNAQGVDGVLNLLGEGVTTSADADAAAAEYVNAIAVAAGQVRTSITLKPSQLGLLFDAAGCAARLRQVAVQAAAVGLGLEVDMEQSSHVAATIETFLSAGLDPLPRLAIQACLHRSPSDLETLIDAGVRTRLVKGAYLEGPGVAIQQTGAINRRYGELSTLLLDRGDDPAFATHDSALIDHVVGEARRLGRDKRDFEFQMLYGIRRDLQVELARAGFRVRAYVPFGPAWYPYLVRRLAERPANLRFFARALVGR